MFLLPQTKSKHTVRTIGLKFDLNVIMSFDLGHDLDLVFSRSNMKYAISQPNMALLAQNKKQTYSLNSGSQMWPLSLTLAVALTLNFQGQILK